LQGDAQSFAEKLQAEIQDEARARDVARGKRKRAEEAEDVTTVSRKKAKVVLPQVAGDEDVDKDSGNSGEGVDEDSGEGVDEDSVDEDSGEGVDEDGKDSNEDHCHPPALLV
jgi:hypothetical protein